MKAKWLPVLIIVLGMLVTVFAINAHATAPSIYRFNGLGASAYYSSVDESGCIFTDVFVQFGQSTSGAPPKPSTQPAFIYMYVSQWDGCSGVYLRSAQTNPPPILPEGAFRVEPSFKSATLNATVELVDNYTNATFAAEVGVVWEATGELQRSTSHNHYKEAWGIYDSTSRGITRNATASGSVIVDGVNLTPSSWLGQAWIEQQVQGSITIFKKP